MPCMYPFPCSNHILKFNHNGKPVYYPPIDPEENTAEEDYVQVYAVNGNHYVHHSTGLTINEPKSRGGRRTRKRHRLS